MGVTGEFKAAPQTKHISQDAAVGGVGEGDTIKGGAGEAVWGSIKTCMPGFLTHQ